MLMPLMRLHPPTPRQTGAERKLPYILRGRDEEFTRLAHSLDLPSQPLHIVEGPPGTGKTSLIRAVAAYAAQRNFTVVSLDASQIRTPAHLIHGIAHHTFMHYPRPRPQIAIHPDDKSISLQIQNIAQHCDKPFRGFLLLIDNAATWRSHTPKKAKHHRDLHIICNVLQDAFRIAQQKPILQTIIAGVPGTIDTIRSLMGGRIVNDQTYRLQNVTDHAIYQIITDHLHLDTPIGPYRNHGPGIPEKTLQALTHDCQGHIWHATVTALKLQKLLQEQPDADYDAIVATAQRAKLTVYGEIKRNLPSKQRELFKILATLALKYGNRIPDHPIKELLKKAAEQQNLVLDLKEWHRNGLMETLDPGYNYARCDDLDQQNDYVQIPAPSFAQWFINKYGPPEAHWEQAIHRFCAEHPPIPEWSWREEPKITEIPDIHPKGTFPPHPWTGTAPEIYELHPLDNLHRDPPQP